MSISRRGFVGGASVAAMVASRSAFVQKKYDDGATDKEIKIGYFCPYPIQAVQMSRFKDDTRELFGDVLSAESA